MSQKIFKNCLDLEALESSHIISRESYLTEKYIFLKKKNQDLLSYSAS